VPPNSLAMKQAMCFALSPRPRMPCDGITIYGVRSSREQASNKLCTCSIQLKHRPGDWKLHVVVAPELTTASCKLASFR